MCAGVPVKSGWAVNEETMRNHRENGTSPVLPEHRNLLPVAAAAMGVGVGARGGKQLAGSVGQYISRNREQIKRAMRKVRDVSDSQATKGIQQKVMEIMRYRRQTMIDRQPYNEYRPMIRIERQKRQTMIDGGGQDEH